MTAGLSAVMPVRPAAAAPCDAPVVSAIACENSKPGSPESEWGISGAGSSSIQGFATDMSVNVGATEGFKIDTAASSYRLDIYRMGYYGGDGARKIATVAPTVLNNQPACLSDSTTGLVDCGNWTRNASWSVPADAVSGIYFAHLVRTDGTSGDSHVFFVVRNDSSGSKLLFQTSDTTWQAYNQYGGNSLYTGSPAGRAYKVSYNRPFTTAATGNEDWVFNAEYPMVRWLESNGYDVSYTSGVDTDRTGAELLEHPTFLSVGQDEYWSGQQRANVEAARAAGVNLAFFSGNEIFWKTRWEKSIDASGTPYRTLVSYKETHDNSVTDPASPIWTGTWRDPRFSPPEDGGRPENALSGTIFKANCCAINMVVGAADGKMRFWRGTRVASLGTNATTTIGSNIIGYEWDEDADNGSRPPGAIRLSQTTGSGDMLQDYGSTYASGSATHAMTLYRARSGALVFGAGTVQWSWALDSNHDRGSAAPDVAAQQATVNLLADMGVQPTTLQAGLVAATASTDTVAPTSVITAPANNATVPVGSAVTVTGTASDTGGGRVGGVEVSTDNGTSWHRATGRESWTYSFTPTANGSLRILSRAADDSANLETPSAGIAVTAGTGPVTCPCSVWPSTQTASADSDRKAVEVGVRFRAATDGQVTGIRFYKPSVATGTHVGTLWTNTGTKLASVTFTGESASGWQQASFASPVTISAGVTYVASYYAPSRYASSSKYFASAATTRGPLTALRDGTDGANGVYRYGSTAGAFPTTSFNSENYWVDVVFQDRDTTRPTLSSRSPAGGATGVAVGTAVSAVLSEPVSASSVNIELRNPAGNVVAGSSAYNATTRTVTLTPAAALQSATTYTATVSGATDAAGNVMAADTWTFTTEAPDTTRPTLTSRSPAGGATGVAVGTKVSGVFSEAVTASSIAFELRNAANTVVASTTAYDAPTRTATLTPSAALAPSTTYTATMSGAADAAGNVMDPVTWSFTTGAASANGCPCTIWASSATPAATDPDTSSVELGVRFRAAQDGYVTGIRYYKPTATSGTHVGTLWTNTGTKLATVNFTGESASGWQQATFTNPVPVSAGVTYVASYFTPTRYAVTSGYFASAATVRGPLTALRDGTDGGNGLYRYGGAAGSFPNNSYNRENYWVDVVFQESAQDTLAPVVVDRSPAAGATGVPTSSAVSATFSEGLQPGSASLELRDASNALVPTTSVAYDQANTRVMVTPNAALPNSTTYTARLSGATDSSGNTMAPVTWTFQTAAPPPPPPDQGPSGGGPIAVVTSSTNPTSTYLVEILRAEGMNEFANITPSTLTAAGLAPYSVVVLGDVPVSDAQVAAVGDWVTAGGNLVLMKPDNRFLPLAGLTAQTGTVSDGYVAVDATTPPGAGITTETMQFHGAANRYSLSGASTVAGLYSSATASTGQPAVTWRGVGTNGGQVAVFAYDLARSVVQTRQGNPAWAGQDRDGLTPNRSNDLFFGGSSADWVNLAKVQIPQADEQQRLLANLIVVMNQDRFPMPRFWYFPGTAKAVVVATGDDHGNGGSAGRFDAYTSASPAGCSVASWQCARFTSFVYPSTPLTNAQASSYNAQGFEIGLHPQNGCANYTSLSNLQTTYTNDLAAWRSKYSGIPSPTTSRFHCIVWSDWNSQPRAELANGIRLDTNYYYYPGSWVADRPGFMNGSGLPMRFTNADGTLLDVYQANTVMTDESDQSYPFTPDSLLDRALGPLGYYGAFVANMHTDQATTFQDTQLLASAQSRSVPVIAARQLLTWLDGRNGSSFGDLSWSSGVLTFSVAVGAGGSGLTAMLPTTGPGGRVLDTLTLAGAPVAFTRATIKGQEYAMFAASAGRYQASYATPSAPLAISAAATTAVSPDSATLAWSTSEATSTTLLLGRTAGTLQVRGSVAERTTNHRVEVTGLKPGLTYRFRVRSARADGTTRTWPGVSAPPATFRTLAADAAPPRITAVAARSLPDGTARVSWRTDEPASSLVRYGRSATELSSSAYDDELVRQHTIVLTRLPADAARSLRISSTDGSGNVGTAQQVVTLRTASPGVAIQSLAEFRTGRATGDLVVRDLGLGDLALPTGGSGAYVSRVLDARQKVDWLRAIVQASLPGSSRLTVSTRTGSTPLVDSSWSSWRPVGADQVVAGAGRYLQFQLELSAPAGTSPAVSAVGFTHSGRLPQGDPEAG